jgi:stringent starvation protein B
MIQGKSSFKSDFDIEKIEEGTSLEDCITIINKAFNRLEFFNKSISFQSNFNGYIAENVKIPAGATSRIEHYLGVTPKNRIIFRQTGNGVVTDVNSVSDWNNKVISLKNNGAEEVVLTVFIARE